MGRRCTSSYEETTKRGAKSYFEPVVEKDANGAVRAGIGAYGETGFHFRRTKNYTNLYQDIARWKSDYNPTPVGLKYTRTTW